MVTSHPGPSPAKVLLFALPLQGQCQAGRVRGALVRAVPRDGLRARREVRPLQHPDPLLHDRQEVRTTDTRGPITCVSHTAQYASRKDCGKEKTKRYATRHSTGGYTTQRNSPPSPLPLAAPSAAWRSARTIPPTLRARARPTPHRPIPNHTKHNSPEGIQPPLPAGAHGSRPLLAANDLERLTLI
jgi:hypothetical protein